MLANEAKTGAFGELLRQWTGRPRPRRRVHFSTHDLPPLCDNAEPGDETTANVWHVDCSGCNLILLNRMAQ